MVVPERVAVVTGGAGAIGSAIGGALESDGLRIVAIDRTGDVTADLSSESSARAAGARYSNATDVVTCSCTVRGRSISPICASSARPLTKSCAYSARPSRFGHRNRRNDRTRLWVGASSCQRWGDSITIVSFGVALVLLVSFVIIEMHSDHPILPFSLFANRNRAASYIVMFTLSGGIFAIFFFLTLYLQITKGYSPLRAGLAFFPFSVAIAATSQIVARLMKRFPPRIFVTVGPLLASLGLLWLSRLDVQSTYINGVLGPILVLGVGLGLTFVPIVLGVTAGVQPAELGIASAVLNTAQQVGGTLGLAILVTIAADATKSALHTGTVPLGAQQAREVALAATLHGYTTAFVVGACIAFAAFLVALVAIHPPASTGVRAPSAIGGEAAINTSAPSLGELPS